jgi:beta-glucuronidase
MLYPRESNTREVKDLSGIWRFKVDFKDIGIQDKWFSRKLENTRPMPVPSSYNDITQESEIRDHVGYVWYETEFYIPDRVKNEQQVILRFGSATHHATVWVNGQETIRHKGGFLPFEIDVTNHIRTKESNLLTVAINNELSWQTLPSGEVVVHDKDGLRFKEQNYHFDFFNYAGIHRPVHLIFRPYIHIDDVSIITQIENDVGIIDYSICATGRSNCGLNLYSSEGDLVSTSKDFNGRMLVSNAILWEPDNPYLYKLKVELMDEKGAMLDVYELPVGIRTVTVSGNKFLINSKEIYLKGFGKHEDVAIRGRGFDNCTNVKDFNLLKWINANSFRTSHYPYAEEVLNLADQEGILIIDECPAVGMCHFGRENGKIFCPNRVNNETLKHHVDVITELIKRDKNHPSVIMWSVGNEAATEEEISLPYFDTVIKKARQLDPTRPVTMAQFSGPGECKVSQLLDVICVNRYYSWYADPGRLETIGPKLQAELLEWYERFKKPIMMSEYGADTITGFHSDPPVMFSEEYQARMLSEYHHVLDSLDFIVGEHVWNFADFATKQGITRVMGNKKGVFTRDRQPKMAAHLLKERWGKK